MEYSSKLPEKSVRLDKETNNLIWPVFFLYPEYKESDFIEICRGSKVITNDVRKIIEDVLDLRNTCAHPNTIIIPESKAISII